MNYDKIHPRLLKCKSLTGNLLRAFVARLRIRWPSRLGERAGRPPTSNDSDGIVLLKGFNQTVRDGVRLEVRGVAKLPLVGKAFRMSTASTQNRSVMLLARPVLVQRQGSKMGGP